MLQDQQPTALGVRGASEALFALLEDLVPEGTVSVADINGHEYQLPPGLSARREVVVIRHIRRALEAPAAVDALGGVSNAAEGDGGSAMLSSLISVVAAVADDAVLGEVEQAFGAAFPEALGNAREAANAPEAGAADLFSLGAMVGALVPFFAREAKTCLRMLGPARKK
jgi:hypothetical protein